MPEVNPLELLLVKPPRNSKAGLLVSVQIPPLLTVTAPTKRLVPVAESSFRVPVREVVELAVRLNVESCRVPAEIVRAPPTVVLPPRVLVPVPEEVIALKVVVAEFSVASPLPENTTVEVPAVKVPPEVMVNSVPEVPDKVTVEALAVSVPAAPMVNVVPLSERLVPSLVFNVPLMVMVPSTFELASMVTV